MHCRFKKFLVPNRFSPLTSIEPLLFIFNLKHISAGPLWAVIFGPIPYSVTRWLDYFSTFGHLHQWKLAQWLTKMAKVGPKFYQIVNKPTKLPKAWIFLIKGWNFAKSGHTDPVLFSVDSPSGLVLRVTRKNCQMSIKVPQKWFH